MVKFLVLALFYGDHPELARRCGLTLRSLWNTGRIDLRVGLNAVSLRSRVILDDLLPEVPMEAADPQIWKYPMMRRLLQGYGGDATHLMWFDDDSCLLPGVDVQGWLDAVSGRAERATGTLGSVYRARVQPELADWAKRQPWYTGAPLPAEVTFNTGGWFVAPLSLLRRWDWPDAAVQHFNGDVSLGLLLQQQGLVPQQFRAGLAINADMDLRESAAPRRGGSMT